MKLMLTIQSCCTVSQTIPVLLTVRRQILLCSRWVDVPALISMTQLASTLSISCNIQHRPQQQGQYKQWSMLRKGTFRHIRQANMEIDTAVHLMTSSSEWRHGWLGSRKSQSPWNIAQLATQKEACGRETMRNALVKHWREWEIVRGLCWERIRWGKIMSWTCRSCD